MASLQQHMEFSGWGSDLSCSCDLYNSCGNTRSFTHCVGQGFKPASLCSWDAHRSQCASGGNSPPTFVIRYSPWHGLPSWHGWKTLFSVTGFCELRMATWHPVLSLCITASLFVVRFSWYTALKASLHSLSDMTHTAKFRIHSLRRGLTKAAQSQLLKDKAPLPCMAVLPSPPPKVLQSRFSLCFCSTESN